ncbi:MAG: phosphate/phosphite/phosphonate ABC transporter substrate-binding protein [Chloroflexi bacterium]|nr:phosphate/phosphite/phosphonate ABC transporter substrate-binding protein [Chloroflexota bacterium]
MMFGKKLIYLFMALLIISACQTQPDHVVDLSDNLVKESVWPTVTVDSADWLIGYDPRLEPKDDVRQVASLAKWLQKQTGSSFGVFIPSPDENVVDDLCAGKTDFAVVGTVSYLQAHEQCGVQILVRGLNAEGKDTYRAAIIVAADSPLQTLPDLRGHTFAFGAINSTQGHLIPRLMLQQAGLALEVFRTYTYSGSHAATANAVTSHRVDAGALQDTLALELAQRGLVRILALSEPYPSSGIVVGPDVPEPIIESVQNALLEVDPTGVDTADLYEWWRTEMPLGFVRASDDEYQELRQIAETIGLLNH